jgi:hypothetical protein
MAVIEMRASRERIEQSLALIRASTTASEALIAESIKETRHAAARSQQLTRDAVENLFRSVYQKNVPKELVDFYESRVFRQNFFRRSDEYIFTLRLPPGAQAEDFMNVSVYHKYTMENLTQDDLDYDFRCETSLPPGEHTGQVASKYSAVLVDSTVVTTGSPKTVEYSGYKALVISHRASIPAGNSREFEARWTSVRRVRDSEVLITEWPSNGITVDVHYDQALEVSVNALHPVALKEVPTGDNSRKWRLTGGMLPGQGISLSWEPKSP